MYDDYDNSEGTLSGAQSRLSSSRDRLMNLIEARRSYMSHLDQQSQKLDEQNRRAAENQALDSSRGTFGLGAQGAQIGTSISPGIGTAIGAGAGLLLGGLSEAHNRKSIHNSQGEKYGWGHALKDTFVRAPSMNEGIQVLGAAGGAIGASMAANRAAAVKNTGVNPNDPYWKSVNQDDFWAQKKMALSEPSPQPFSTGEYSPYDPSARFT